MTKSVDQKITASEIQELIIRAQKLVKDDAVEISTEGKRHGGGLSVHFEGKMGCYEAVDHPVRGLRVYIGKSSQPKESDTYSGYYYDKPTYEDDEVSKHIRALMNERKGLTFERGYVSKEPGHRQVQEYSCFGKTIYWTRSKEEAILEIS